MGEVKYGRKFRLSNGETEYIELSKKSADSACDRDYAINYLKDEVYKHHCITERRLEHERNPKIYDKYISTMQDCLHFMLASLNSFGKITDEEKESWTKYIQDEWRKLQ